MSHDLQQAISHVLQQDSKVLEGLFLKIRQLKQLQQAVDEHIDQKLIGQYQVANLDNGCLIILTDSASCATQFRFQIPDLLPKLRVHPLLYHLKHIQCKIRPAITPFPANRKTHTIMPRLSEDTARLLINTADTIQHPKLQTAMKSIANKTRHSSRG